MDKKTQDYLDRAKIIHNNQYEYLVDRIETNKQKINIVCKVHGIFQQMVSSHINAKQGCGRCNGRYTKTKEEVLEEIKEKHGNKYQYLDFEYKNNTTKIGIICFTHGLFYQNTKEHIKGSGCPKCSKNYKLDTNEFIKKARLKHKNQYDYSKVDYLGNEIKIKILCPKHGEFEQSPHGHLMGYGCSKCVANSSKQENCWLDSFNNKNIKRQHKLKIGNKTYNVDGFDPVTKTVYEFYGSLFHGDPRYVDWLDLDLPRNIRTNYKTLYDKTIERENIITSAGFSLVKIWEFDWKAGIKPKFKSEIKFRNRANLKRLYEAQTGMDRDSEDEFNYILEIR